MKKLFATLLIFLPLIIQARKEGKAYLDSLVAGLPGTKEDTSRVLILNRISLEDQNIDPAEGLAYATQELNLATKLNWKKGIGLAYNSLGVNCDAKAEYDKSLDYHFAALKINEEIQDKKETAISLENIAFTYQDKSDHPKALDYNLRALKLFEEVGDREGVAATSGAIGSVYQSERNYDKALEYHLKAMDIHKSIGNKSGLAANMGNIGIVYERKGNYDKALEYDLMALDMYENLGDKRGKIKNLGNMGNVYTSLRDYAKALDNDFKALAIAQELGDKNLIGANLGNIGETYLLIAKDTRAPKPDDHISGKTETNVARAIEYLNNGVAVCRQIGLLDAVVEFTQSLSDAYTLAGDTKNALENYKRYAALRDSIYSDENKNKISLISNKYEEELKAKDVQIRELAASKKHNEHLFFIGGVCMVVLVIGIVLKNISSQK